MSRKDGAINFVVGAFYIASCCGEVLLRKNILNYKSIYGNDIQFDLIWMVTLLLLSSKFLLTIVQAAKFLFSNITGDSSQRYVLIESRKTSSNTLDSMLLYIGYLIPVIFNSLGLLLSNYSLKWLPGSIFQQLTCIQALLVITFSFTCENFKDFLWNSLRVFVCWTGMSLTVLSLLRSDETFEFKIDYIFTDVSIAMAIAQLCFYFALVVENKINKKSYFSSEKSNVIQGFYGIMLSLMVCYLGLYFFNDDFNQFKFNPVSWITITDSIRYSQGFLIQIITCCFLFALKSWIKIYGIIFNDYDYGLFIFVEVMTTFFISIIESLINYSINKQEFLPDTYVWFLIRFLGFLLVEFSLFRSLCPKITVSRTELEKV